jgi:CheY-like chemotaxis protein
MKAAAQGSNGAAAPERPVVLVAEDEESLRGMLELVLHSRGYDVRLCSDGLRAQAAIEGPGRIDAVLLDLRMPGVNGRQLLTCLRELPQRTAVHAIAMSAFSDDLQVREMLEAGADAFLAKPFTIDELTSTLDRLMHRPPRVPASP